MQVGRRLAANLFRVMTSVFGGRRILRAIVLTLLCVAVAGPAKATVYCVLSGLNGEYKVARIDTSHGIWVRPSYSQRDPLQAPFVEEGGNATALGVFFYGESGPYSPYGISFMGTAPPRAKVEMQGRVLVDTPVPSTRAAGVHSWADGYPSGFMGLPRKYVIVLSSGATSGLTGTGRWTVSIYAEGYGCTEVAVPGEITQFDQTDFSGGTQAYYPPSGVGTGLRYTHTSDRLERFGIMYANASGGTAATTDLRLPSMGKRVGNGSNVKRIDYFTAGRWPLDFELDYRGADALASVTILDLDLDYNNPPPPA